MQSNINRNQLETRLSKLNTSELYHSIPIAKEETEGTELLTQDSTHTEFGDLREKLLERLQDKNYSKDKFITIESNVIPKSKIISNRQIYTKIKHPSSINSLNSNSVSRTILKQSPFSMKIKRIRSHHKRRQKSTEGIFRFKPSWGKEGGEGRKVMLRCFREQVEKTYVYDLFPEGNMESEIGMKELAEEVAQVPEDKSPIYICKGNIPGVSKVTVVNKINKANKSNRPMEESHQSIITPKSHQSIITPESHQSMITPESHQSIITPESHQSIITPESHQSIITPESHQSIITPESHQSIITPESHQSIITPESHQSIITPESHQSIITPESHQSIITPESHQSIITPESHQSIITPESHQSIITPESHQSIITPESHQSIITPESHQSIITPESHQSIITPESHQSIITPESHQSIITPESHQSIITPESHQSIITPESHQSIITPESHQSIITPHSSSDSNYSNILRINSRTPPRTDKSLMSSPVKWLQKAKEEGNCELLLPNPIGRLKHRVHCLEESRYKRHQISDLDKWREEAKEQEQREKGFLHRRIKSDFKWGDGDKKLNSLLRFRDGNNIQNIQTLTDIQNNMSIYKRRVKHRLGKTNYETLWVKRDTTPRMDP